MKYTTADIERARSENAGYLETCYRHEAECIAFDPKHIAKLEAIRAGLDALDEVRKLRRALDDFCYDAAVAFVETGYNFAHTQDKLDAVIEWAHRNIDADLIDGRYVAVGLAADFLHEYEQTV